MKTIRNIILTWLFIFVALCGTLTWFVHSDTLNQYDWVRNQKQSVKDSVQSYYQTKKNSFIASVLNEVGYQPNNVMLPNTNTNTQASMSPVNLPKKPDNNVNTAPSSNIDVTTKNVDLNQANKDNELKFSKLVVPFYYDHSAAPDNLSKEDVLGLVSKASAAWTEACGVSFEYRGDRLTDYINQDRTLSGQTGVVKWGNLSGTAIGQAHQGSARGLAKGFVLTLSPNFFKNKANTGYLYSTILHEMGHVIGLGHSKNPNSIMYYEQTNRKQILNETDKAMCRYMRLRWQGATAAQASEKTGVLVNEQEMLAGDGEEVETSGDDGE